MNGTWRVMILLCAVVTAITACSSQSIENPPSNVSRSIEANRTATDGSPTTNSKNALPTETIEVLRVEWSVGVMGQFSTLIVDPRNRLIRYESIDRDMKDGKPVVSQRKTKEFPYSDAKSKALGINFKHSGMLELKERNYADVPNDYFSYVTADGQIMSKHGAIRDGWSIRISYGPNTWSLDNGYKNEFLMALRGVAAAYPETKQVLNEPIEFLLKEAAKRITGKAQ